MNGTLYVSLNDYSSADIKNINSCAIYFTNGRSSSVYTGKSIDVCITVKDGTRTLLEGTDYDVIIKDNTYTEVNSIKYVGVYTIEIIGKNKYTGIATIKFTVVGNRRIIKLDDMYNTYDDENFDFYNQFSFEKRNLPYLQMVNNAKDTWEYPISETDTKVVSTAITGEALKDGEYLQLSLCNFRLEEVTTIQTTEIENDEAIFSVDNTNLKLLLPDVYYYSVSLYDKNNEKIKTIKDVDDECFFYVKDNTKCLQ